jgi:hypothetical protein
MSKTDYGKASHVLEMSKTDYGKAMFKLHEIMILGLKLDSNNFII